MMLPYAPILLDCRIRGCNRLVMHRIASSLEHFYSWLKANGWIVESPFEKFNLKPAVLWAQAYLAKKPRWPFQGLPDDARSPA